MYKQICRAKQAYHAFLNVHCRHTFRLTREIPHLHKPCPARTIALGTIVADTIAHI